jgi:hypothetical protein
MAQLGPHIPALAVFGIVFLILSRLGLSTMGWNLIAPTVLAIITEIVKQLV